MTRYPPSRVRFNVGLAVKLLPKFSEKNIEEYLISFEKIAEINEWPAGNWSHLLQTTLTGKGLGSKCFC